MNTNKVAQRAGVSIGSLYQYFPNKQAILVALLERHLSQLRPVIEESLQEMGDPSIPYAVATRRMFVRLLDLHADDPELQRALTEEVPHPPHVRQLHEHGEERYTARVAQILRQRPDVHVADVEAAAHVLVEATSALSRWLAHEPPRGVAREACLDEVVRLLCRYVGAEPGCGQPSPSLPPPGTSRARGRLPGRGDRSQ
jgi:AcrR family transcriptional regulator